VNAAARAPAIAWSRRFAVGIGVIDGQHREMLQLVNKVLAGKRAGRETEALVEVLRELVRCTKHHFATEERLMDEVGAKAARHRAEHRKLLQNLERYTDRLDDDTLAAAPAFLRKWLLEHIEAVDRPFAALLRKHGVN
jgi:methyl-accepting chemotaxis protein/hemerythrin